MKTIAIWGQRNPFKTRFLISLCHLLLITLAVSWGCSLYETGIHLSTNIAYAAVLLFFIVATIYPIRKAKNNLFANTFQNRKISDLILIICTTISICVFSNDCLHHPPMAQQIVQKTSPKTSTSFLKKIHHKQRKWVAKQLQKQVLLKGKRKASSSNRFTFGRFIAILLNVVLAGVLISLLLALSCNLSCSGNGILAVLVFIVGFIAILYLISKIFRTILKSRVPKDYKDIIIDEKDPDKDLYFQ